MYGVIIEAGNCMYCGKHIDNGGSIFLCEECRRKVEERECPHERLKETGTDTVKSERPITVKEPKQRPPYNCVATEDKYRQDEEGEADEAD